MSTFVTSMIAALSASLALVARYVVTKVTHRGSVRVSDAETIFKASESVRNDMAEELRETRKDRDHYLDRLNDCLEARRRG